MSSEERPKLPVKSLVGALNLIEAILNEMIECKQTIISANATLEAIAEIEADLASEVKEVVEKVFED